MKDFFDYGIADQVHELSNDTAQGNALGTLAQSVDKIAVLTGTLMGGYPPHRRRRVPAYAHRPAGQRARLQYRQPPLLRHRSVG